MAQKYDHWEIVEALGEGGQGHTFLVLNTNSDSTEQFVLKRLKNIKRLDRFKREIEAIKSLKHPNILELVDYNLTSKKPYFVSRWAEGGSLADHKEDYKNKPIETLVLISAIADGLWCAHQHQPSIVHRDIKPANIFLLGPNRTPVIGDFGICHVDDGQRLTLIDEAVGPRLFCPPELEDGPNTQIEGRSDIYSLGKLLYWLLAGGVFARERHRDPQYDLKSIFSNDDYEHINRLLDHMVVANISDRFVSENVATMARHIIDLSRKGAPAIFPGATVECIFCKTGIYEQVDLDRIGAAGFGLAQMATAQWHVLVCRNCGNLQLFRLEFIQPQSKKTYWGK